ncbi:MAG: hypothetical protein ABSC62_05700 [Terracidiphilus sp.]|jgi:hypothetical protein
MKITIQGQDYTAAFDAVHPLTIARKINAPSICELWLSLPSGGSLAAPSRFQTLDVTGDDGTIYFTGYIALSPLPEYAGLGIEGPRYRTAIQAVSDELLLDQLLMPPSSGTTQENAGVLLASLVTHTGSTALSTKGLSLNTLVGNFTPDRGANWSKIAGQAASMARASYRVLSGAVALSPVQTTVHSLNETDGSLSLANLAFTASVKRALANDVTVCGENEPVAYVTEYFLGDGSTTEFDLAADPYFPSTSESTIISELFNEPEINQSLWSVSGGAGYLTLGASGLAMNGGNGIDGQTLLTWIDPVEMGGTLLLEAVGVTLSPGSTGIVAGFFNSLETAANCTAGFQVTAQQGSGAVTLQPIVQGSLAGTTYALNSSNQYTLRVRVHCPECHRAQAVYYSFGDSGLIAAGGEWSVAPGKIQMEVQEFVNGVGATPVTLYDGAIASLPGACMVAPASSINLIGTMRAVNLTNLGSGWVVSTPPGGGAYTRRVGTTAEAAECHLERTGKITFYTGYIPVAGEQIAVSYRTIGRAVGRAVNAASQQALIQAGSPAVAAWIGSVTHPPARSSADCRNAALVMEQAAASVSALWSGTYKGNRNSFATDVWPGDALLLTAPSTSLNAEVVVRSVKVTYQSSYPDLVEYEIAFANDWADDLAIKTSTAVPDNAWLPANTNLTVLSNLNRLTVTALNGSTVTVNTGVTPPAGGGFEVRLRDFAFVPGEDPALVMRGSQQNLTFSRVSASDRFYIRMYDGSTPPNYSEFSTALFINLPLSS